MTKIIKNLIIIAVIAIVALALFFWIGAPKKSIEVGRGQISDVKTMAQLCTIDLYNEVPVLDTINNKVLFAVQKQRGSVSFDLENMQVNTDGDTVKIVLSPEIVEINEATEDNSWQVIDSKNLSLKGYNPLASNKLTDEEENQIKKKIKTNSKKILYHNGTIERARAEAVKNLQTLMTKVYRKPVVVTDPTPKDAHYDEYK